MIRSLLFVVRSDRTFPSCRFRAYQMQPPLERLGVHVTFLRTETSLSPRRQLAFRRELATQARRHDAVIYQKLLHPFRIRHAARHNTNLFYDIDDALYLTSSMRKFARTLRAAPRVIVGNDFLAERARVYNPRVDVVPTTVVVPDEVHPAGTQPGFRLSWMGSACNLHYLEPVRNAVSELRRQGRDVRLHILTEAPREARPQEGVVVDKWSFEAEERALRECDVGLMPLTDDEWSRGKCACKALQYLSYAKPVISSPVGVNEKMLADQPYALLPRTADQWRDAILRFVRSRDALAELGTQGRAMVQARYSVDVWAPRLAEILSRNASGTMKNLYADAPPVPGS